MEGGPIPKAVVDHMHPEHTDTISKGPDYRCERKEPTVSFTFKLAWQRQEGAIWFKYLQMMSWYNRHTEN